MILGSHCDPLGHATKSPVTARISQSRLIRPCAEAKASDQDVAFDSDGDLTSDPGASKGLIPGLEFCS